MLTVDPEPFPAGGQQADRTGLPQQPLGENRGGAGDMLAVIENKQDLLPGQVIDELIVEAPERPFAEPGRGGDGPDHGLREGHRREIAEDDAAGVVAGRAAGHLQRQPGLPHASRAVQGEQACLAQQPGHGREVLVPPDETGHRHGNRQCPRRPAALIAGARRGHCMTQDIPLHAQQVR